MTFSKNACIGVCLILGLGALNACEGKSAAVGMLPSNGAVGTSSAAGSDSPTQASLGGAVVRGFTSLDASHSVGDALDIVRGLRLVRSSKSTQTTLYASLFEGELFSGYALPNKKPFCKSALVQQTTVNSIGVDSTGNVWLPTQFASYVNQTVSYSPDCKATGIALAAPASEDPAGIVFGSDGTRFVLMVSQPPGQNPGTDGSSVSAYAGSSTNPTGELSDRRLDLIADGIGIDSKGNVYVSCCGSKTRKHTHDIYVIQFKPGGSTHHGQRIPLAQLGQPAGSISFDRSSNMIVPERDIAAVNVYGPPYTGSPTIYPLKGIPWQCALDQPGTTFACADLSNDTIDLYAYPSLRYRYSLKSTSYPSIQLGGVAFASSP